MEVPEVSLLPGNTEHGGEMSDQQNWHPSSAPCTVPGEAGGQ